MLHVNLYVIYTHLKKKGANIPPNVNSGYILGYLFIFWGGVFLGPNPWHMEVPRLGVKLELLLLACATATATPDPSCICSLHHSSQQHWMLKPLSKARDQTCVLMDPSQIRFHCTTKGTPGAFKMFNCRVPVMVQRKQIWLGSMRMQVWSLASLSGLRIGHCRELWWRLQMHLGSGIAVAVA